MSKGAHVKESIFPAVAILDFEEVIEEIEKSGKWELPTTRIHGIWKDNPAGDFYIEICEDWIRFLEEALEGCKIVDSLTKEGKFKINFSAVENYSIFYNHFSGEIHDKEPSEYIESILRALTALKEDTPEKAGKEDRINTIKLVKNLSAHIYYLNGC